MKIQKTVAQLATLAAAANPVVAAGTDYIIVQDYGAVGCEVVPWSMPGLGFLARGDFGAHAQMTPVDLLVLCAHYLQKIAPGQP